MMQSRSIQMYEISSRRVKSMGVTDACWEFSHGQFLLEGCKVTGYVELQRQFLARRRAGALPLQARLERRSLSSCALLTHRELSLVFSLGASLPPFLPNQVTLQLHFRCSHELRTLSETFHRLGV